MTEHVQDLASLDVHMDSTGWKSGVRVLGIAESFGQSDESSTVAGVVMRGDIRIDGYSFCHPTVGGLDATEKLASMYESLHRQDIRAWMLGGSVISWFNIVDLHKLHERTGTPVACVSYRPSEGIEKFVKEYFPNDWEKRLDVLNRTGERVQISLSTGYQVYLSVSGMTVDKGRRLIDLFTLDGAVPEPIRAARILAASIRHSGFI